MIYSPWFIEFVLECIGAIAYSRRSKMLSALLTVCALTDSITFYFYQVARQSAYAWSYWAARGLKYQLLLWLGCSICGMFVAEKQKFITIASTAFISLGSGALIMSVGMAGETLKDKLLDGEIAANFLLFGLIFLGWLGRRDRLTGAWKWITAGFMLMIGSDLLFTILWTFWEGARHFYPIGAITAQVTWIYGAVGKLRLDEFRSGLGVKIKDAERVSVC